MSWKKENKKQKQIDKVNTDGADARSNIIRNGQVWTLFCGSQTWSDNSILCNKGDKEIFAA